MIEESATGQPGHAQHVQPGADHGARVGRVPHPAGPAVVVVGPGHPPGRRRQVIRPPPGIRGHPDQAAGGQLVNQPGGGGDDLRHPGRVLPVREMADPDLGPAVRGQRDLAPAERRMSAAVNETWVAGTDGTYGRVCHGKISAST